MIKQIALLTSDGEITGMKAALRAITRAVRRGFAGLRAETVASELLSAYAILATPSLTIKRTTRK